ncbi:MAG: multidrug effflux MFS transporter [Pseudomonadota bacterium]
MLLTIGKISKLNRAVSDDRPPLGRIEQIGLLALLISLVAMSIDAILPALPAIGGTLVPDHPNAPQLLIGALLVGLTIGQLIYGPVSDSYGRRMPILIGLAVFMVGALIAAVSTSFEAVLLGRFIQGVGAAGPRVVAVALVRDRYEGAAMAQIMSFVMAVFIIVPALAPAIGEAVLHATGSWRAIFVMFLIQAATASVWFWIRQPETHRADRRRPLSFRSTASAMGQALQHPVSRGYAMAAGIVFGSFVGFLASIQQIFTDTFGAASSFTTAFAVLALAIGAASVANSQLVMRFGMQVLCRIALTGLASFAFIGWVISLNTGTGFPMLIFMALMMPCCFCFGILFGNFNALAMQPMATIAGSAAAVIAALTSLIAVTFGTLVGQGFDGTTAPLFAGFLIAAMGAFSMIRYTETARAHAPARV